MDTWRAPVGASTRILDLCCGPGLYASRLARPGHECVGVDFSHASIAYARAQAESEGLPCGYVEGDVRTVDYGTGYDLAMLIFGEFNAFRPTEAKHILRSAHRALLHWGCLLLEPHAFELVRETGQRPPSWYTENEGLFSPRPHICLEESFWDMEACVATERYLIIDALTGEVTRHASSMQAYTDDQYRIQLEECGFSTVEIHPSLRGVADESQRGLMVVVAWK